ncbi:hypothetical protein H2204_002862 [Knufia peltigerae]|uniref:Heterokaryon incompatibility domain-containing protein n=1 Tax=Knufia peltigerae TaxID=1002370 RepID=A0AA38YBN1_9EURO|nr:hypothetical protein H2204_002862 [Knufia peltigerae]
MIRLINTKSMEMEEFQTCENVIYAILSHRWEEDEISFEQFLSGDIYNGSEDSEASPKRGNFKIHQCCKTAADNGIHYVWVDTCCIDKKSSAELQEAINSMFHWYQEAEECYAYLSDVESTHDLPKSAWFTRGWTLQELIAPRKMAFFNAHWQPLGTKSDMVEGLSNLTGIPQNYLNGNPLSDCSIAQKMSWVANRVTTRPEDLAYCLLGIFDVHLTVMYGEGKRAFQRLQEEIIRSTSDQTILAWSGPDYALGKLLADQPPFFYECKDIQVENTSSPQPSALTNLGLSVSLYTKPWATETYVAIVGATGTPGDSSETPLTWIGIYLRPAGRDGQFYRVRYLGEDIFQSNQLQVVHSGFQRRRILILNKPRPSNSLCQLHQQQQLIQRFFHGFQISMVSNPLVFVDVDGSGNFDFCCSSGDVGDSELAEDGRRCWKVDMLDGEQGIFLDLSGDLNDGPAGVVYFGFDVEFNPVCLIVNKAQLYMDQATGVANRRVNGVDLYPQGWINKEFQLRGRNAWSWAVTAMNEMKYLVVPDLVDSYLALRGDYFKGLCALIAEMGVKIEMERDWQNRCWNVSLMPTRHCTGRRR